MKVFSSDYLPKNLKEEINNYLVYGENGWQCAACGFLGRKDNIRQHIEARHMENTNVSCEVCGKVYKTKHSLHNHVASKHYQNQY